MDICTGVSFGPGHATGVAGGTGSGVLVEVITASFSVIVLSFVVWGILVSYLCMHSDGRVVVSLFTHPVSQKQD